MPLPPMVSREKVGVLPVWVIFDVSNAGGAEKKDVLA